MFKICSPLVNFKVGLLAFIELVPQQYVIEKTVHFDIPVHLAKSKLDFPHVLFSDEKTLHCVLDLNQISDSEAMGDLVHSKN